jgi:sugar transferase EpsL
LGVQRTDSEQTLGAGQREYRGKRGFDLLVIAVVAAPALAISGICALVIWLTSRGPVIFRQERVGRDGQAFTLLKFRTMLHDSLVNPVVPDGDRITPVGRVLRRLSLDELPQLVNVLRGEMSVVGPRPTLHYQVARYDRRQRNRLAVRPGITGLAQVSGRNRLSWAERIDLDLDYVRRQSVWLDVYLFALTLPVLITGRGATGHPKHDAISMSDQP